MTSTALQVSNRQLGDLIRANENAISQALASKPLRFAEFVVALDNAVAREPKLAQLLERNPNSVKNAVLTCALLGLRPGPVHKHFALVPFGDECVGIPEWRGYVEIANQAGELDSALIVDVVYEFEIKPPKGEEKRFSYDRETGKITHELDITDEHDALRHPDKLVAAYATCRVKDRSGWATVVLAKRDVIKRRGVSASWKNKGEKSAWGTDPVAMWKKSAVRALFESGKIPMSRDVLAEIKLAETEAEKQATGDIEPETVKQADATVVATAPPPQDVVVGVGAVETGADTLEPQGQVAEPDTYSDGRRIVESTLAPKETDVVWRRQQDGKLFEIGRDGTWGPIATAKERKRR